MNGDENRVPGDETLPFAPEDDELDGTSTSLFEDGKTQISRSAHGVKPIGVQVPALEQVKGPGSPQVLLLSKPVYILGRSPEVDSATAPRAASLSWRT